MTSYLCLINTKTYDKCDEPNFNVYCISQLSDKRLENSLMTRSTIYANTVWINSYFIYIYIYNSLAKNIAYFLFLAYAVEFGELVEYTRGFTAQNPTRIISPFSYMFWKTSNFYIKENFLVAIIIFHLLSRRNTWFFVNYYINLLLIFFKYIAYITIERDETNFINVNIYTEFSWIKLQIYL